MFITHDYLFLLHNFSYFSNMLHIFNTLLRRYELLIHYLHIFNTCHILLIPYFVLRIFKTNRVFK
jgi:hypothetical protein